MITTGISGILLAAGLSSRMGKLKALLPWHGVPLIQYQIEQMQNAGIKKIIVVLGHQKEELEKAIATYDVEMVFNENYKLGKSTSIQNGAAAIKKQDQAGILISSVDQPVPSDTLMKMANHLKTTQAHIVIPVFQERKGHPILFHGDLKNDLLNVNEQSKGLRQVIRTHTEKIAYLHVSDPSILLNFNNIEEYSKNIHKEAYNESFGN